jgi:hypothetical protein
VARWLKNNDGDRAAARRDLEALAKDGNEIAADAVELIDKGSDGLTRNFVVFDEELLNRINVLDGDGKPTHHSTGQVRDSSGRFKKVD